MDQAEIETLIKNIDARTKRIEQILPTFATKDDLQAFSTRDDLQAFATRDDLQAFATKDDLQAFATKDDVRQEGERTRRHFDAVAEEMKAQIGLIAEGHKATRVYVDKRLDDTRATLESYDKRIMKLEAKTMKTDDNPKRRRPR